MGSFFLLKWGAQILCLFNQNQTPRSDSAHLEPSEAVLGPQIQIRPGDLPWSDPDIHAPTIKALGENGLRLGHQYAWHWCAPTRGALLSGRLPMHSGYKKGGMPGDGIGLDLKLPLLPAELKTASPP